MTIPFNLRKFDQYQPKRTDIKSYPRIKQFRSCNLKHWYAGTEECYSWPAGRQGHLLWIYR